MAAQKKPTDQQILSRLARRSTPATAAELHTTAARLRALDGVEAVGVRKNIVKGKARAGRPAVLFALSEAAQAREGAGNETEVTA